MVKMISSGINRKKIVALFFLIAFNYYAYSQPKNKKEFEYHFHVLDSLASINKSDTIYTINYNKSIVFMERRTKINASTNGTYYGKLGYTKNDLKKWHEWYIKKNILK